MVLTEYVIQSKCQHLVNQVSLANKKTGFIDLSTIQLTFHLKSKCLRHVFIIRETDSRKEAHRKNAHRKKPTKNSPQEKCPQGKMPRGKNAHKEKCLEGNMPTRKNAHTEKCSQGCYFHLCQSLVRKIQSVFLKSEFECNMECKLLLKSLAALSFVPADDEKGFFGTLAQSFPDKESYNTWQATFIAQTLKVQLEERLCFQ